MCVQLHLALLVALMLSCRLAAPAAPLLIHPAALQHPHEAFGMVFNFDGVVADLHTIRREAWVLLAAQLGLPLPAQVLAHPELHTMPPEVAVVRMLRWANDRKQAVQLAMQHAELAGQLLATHNRCAAKQKQLAGCYVGCCVCVYVRVCVSHLHSLRDASHWQIHFAAFPT